jgi:Protein of unknown function (DUF3305)
MTTDKPRKRVAVIMQRRAIDSRWQSEAWEATGVLADYDREINPRVIVDEPGATQWLYPGFDIVLQRSEAEGYFHNVSTVAPNVFVLWRMEESRAEESRAVPHYVTVSYDEASRWMDGGAQVDAVAMPPGMRDWVRTFVEQHYRPEPKKRMRPQSFLSPKDRGRVGTEPRPASSNDPIRDHCGADLASAPSTSWRLQP